MSLYSHEGVNLYYEVKGDPKSEKVVAFFNGVMASTSSWVNQLEVFERLGYKIVLHDFKGQLKSDKPSGVYSFKEHAEEAKGLLQHLGVRKAHIVGTSYGGEVALRFALDYPDIVESISVIASVSELDEVVKNMIKGWKFIAEFEDAENFFYGMLPTIYSSHYLEGNKEFIKSRGEAFKLLPKEYYKGQISLYKTFESDVTMTHLLSRITCPCLVVCGEDDILKPKKFSEIIAGQIPFCEFVTIPNCGHVVIFEKPNELNSLLLGFIVKHS